MALTVLVAVGKLVQDAQMVVVEIVQKLVLALVKKIALVVV